MDDNLLNINEVMAELEGLAIRTSQGTFVKQEDVRRLLEKRQEARAIDAKEAPAPKTLEQARSQAKKYLAEVNVKDKRLPELGRSVQASEAQPSSRT